MLRIRDLKKSYPQPGAQPLPVLDIPTFELQSGEQMAIIGRSGCGKTTLLHSIAGICKVDSGSVHIGDINLCELTEAGRDRVRAVYLGYVFQTFNLLSAFTALENVALGMTFSPRKPVKDGPQGRARAKWLLEQVGLGHRLNHKPRALSVGEQQRVAVARAMVNRPSLLLADEPTANIDPTNQQLIVDLIRERCSKENVALIMVTHAMEVAEQFDRVDRLDQINLFAPSDAASTRDTANQEAK